MTIEKSIVKGLGEVVAYAEGKKKPARSTTIVPTEINVVAIRERMHLSQQAFADRYGFPIGTIRNWEQGRRTPEGAARLLLQLIDSKPNLVEQIVHGELQEKTAAW
ncbi:MAG: helix-turn-helix domain-containing protein [Hydrogenophaga sp.]|nr:helix-turn-helix domain-containing protein [Hydrogenophaga sp.]